MRIFFPMFEVNCLEVHLEIEKIIRYSLRNNICRFNVSLINNGSLLQPLSYEILYEIVKKEIEYSIWVDENIIKF